MHVCTRSAIRIIAIVFTSAAVTAFPSEKTAGQASVMVRLRVRNSPEATVKGHLIARSVADPSVRKEIAIEDGNAVVAGNAGSAWEVEYQGPGLWAPVEVLTLAEGTVGHQLLLWPTSHAKGKLVLNDKRLTLPTAVQLAVESPPMPAKAPEIPREARFDCEVASDGTFGCVLPAANLDLVVLARGFTPLYRWSVEVSVGKAADLGLLTMTQGASVVAWLDAESVRSVTGTQAHARLIRMLSASDPSPIGSRLKRAVAESAFNKRGAVQLSPVPPGTYVLEVIAPGFAAARAFPIQVFDRKETTLRRAVKLERPLTIRITVDPPKDAVGVSWDAELTQASEFSSGFDPSPSFRGRVNDSGVFEAANQAPGRFVIVLRDSLGNAVLSKEIRIRDETDARQKISVALRAVRGKLTYAGEPLAATLLFGGRDGAVRVKSTSDELGSFACSLPSAGQWRVDINSNDGSVSSTAEVSVPETNELAIDLPKTAVSGWVLNPDGGRDGGADVTLAIAGKALAVRADSDGNYQFRGVPAGSARVQAHDRRTGGNSSEVVMILSTDAQREGVELQIVGSRRLAGRVVSGETPVIGARVAAYAVGVAHGEMRRALSDEDGRFEVQLAEVAHQALVVISDPGRVLQAFRVQFGDEPITLDIFQSGGTVVLDFPSKYSGLRLTQNQIPIPPFDFYDWASGHGDLLTDPAHLRLPQVAPGVYRACISPAPSQQGSAGSEAPVAPARCAEGTLALGSTLNLDLTH